VTGCFDNSAKVWDTKVLKCDASEIFFATLGACYERAMDAEHSLQKLEPFVKDISELKILCTQASLAMKMTRLQIFSGSAMSVARA